MAREQFYRQCRMTKKTPAGEKVQTSYIPEDFAKVGKVLKLRADGVWEDGWVVQTASANRVHADLLPDSYASVKGHRKATGDSLPK